MSSLEPVLQRISAFFGVTHAVPVGSGTVGLRLALEALGAKGRRVVLPALACPNVAVAIRAADATPVLVDMCEATYDLSLDALARTLDETVAAIVAINAFGYPSALEGIRALARRWDCALVEDACQSYGGHVGGAALGARGDVGIVSFGHAKPLELGGGGLVLTNDGALAERMRTALSSSAYGRLPGLKNRMALGLMRRGREKNMLSWDRGLGLLRYTFPEPQFFALEQRWDAWLGGLRTVREEVHAAAERLARLPWVEPFAYTGRDWLPWRYSFKVAPGADVEAMRRSLKAHGVRTSRLYRPARPFLAAEVPHPLPSASDLAERTLNLLHRTTPDEIAGLRDSIERAVQEIKSP